MPASVPLCLRAKLGAVIAALRRVGVALALVGTGAALGAGNAGAAIQTPLPEGPEQCLPGVFGMEVTSETCAATLVDGRAVPPPHAPAAVKAVIAAADRIDHRSYVWGGGHLGFRSRGEAGVGRWITVYANSEHVYMVVAGLRYDTRDDLPGVSGPRWHREMVPAPGFSVRHPVGL